MLPPAGYWANTLYHDPTARPALAAPLRRLPVRSAGRFRRAREGLHHLEGVTEQVVFMGVPWRWVWMFELGGRKVAYLHPMRNGLSATFIVTQHERPHFEVAELPEPARTAYREGELQGSVLLCWMDLPNLTAVEGLLAAVALKHRLLATAA